MKNLYFNYPKKTTGFPPS